MRMEVAVTEKQSTSDKGKLLQDIAGEFLETQGYRVVENVRVTAVELDLLCEHTVSRKRLYVECKAHRDPLSSGVLTKLLGTITLKGYEEGWLVSAGPLGKDAKGFLTDWEARPPSERQKLSIYTPDRVIDALVRARIIMAAPPESVCPEGGAAEGMGDWVLLLTPFGRFWAGNCIQSGVPAGVLVFRAEDRELVDDTKLLQRLAQTDSSVKDLDFEYVLEIKGRSTRGSPAEVLEQVVEVQQADRWADYRPARPQDFVGRYEAQKTVLDFLDGARSGRTNTRIFAITGDSGLGKSSLIAKLRQTLSNIRHRKKYYFYPVDVRAAKGPSYVLCSLLACVRKAVGSGFGTTDAAGIKVVDPSEPLAGHAMDAFLRELQKRGQLVCLVFDQFEELFSKSQLFPVFEQALRLSICASSAQSNFVLGFAWRTDATVPQDHPAYYFWHHIADHRLEIRIGPFRHSDASKAITLFEKELGQAIRPELRRYLVESSQGYPWLLKKLCMHVYEQIESGVSQARLSDRALDIASLFDRDMQRLTKAESACVRVIAERAPVEWCEVLEISGQRVVGALQDKRLIVRSGDHLNLYWDIFREYVLTKSPPSIPFTYLPSAPSINSLLSVARQLRPDVAHAYDELARSSGLSEKTVGNVVRDLTMFGVAVPGVEGVKLDPGLERADARDVLERIRFVLRRHALTLKLVKMEEGTHISTEGMVRLLKEINPAAGHRADTWRVYAERMGHWLFAAGFLLKSRDGWTRKDRGGVTEAVPRPRGRTGELFTADAPPARAVRALDWLKEGEPQSEDSIRSRGYRNAAQVLRRLGLVRYEPGRGFVVNPGTTSGVSSADQVWHAARAEPTLEKVIAYLRKNPAAKGGGIGHFVNGEFGKNWAPASEHRVGNALRQWASWIILGIGRGRTPPPPGPLVNARRRADETPDLFR